MNTQAHLKANPSAGIPDDRRDAILQTELDWFSSIRKILPKTLQRIGGVLHLTVWLLQLTWRQSRVVLLLSIVTMSALAALPLVENWYLGQILEALTQKEGSIWYALVGYVSATTSTSVFLAAHGHLYQLLWIRTAAIVKIQELRDKVRLDLAAHQSAEIKSMLQRISDGGHLRPSNMLASALLVYRYAIGILLSALALGKLDFWMLLVVTSAALPSFFVELKYGERSFGVFSAQSPFFKRYWALASQFFQPQDIEGLKLGQHTQYFIHEIEKINNSIDRDNISTDRNRARAETLAGISGHILIIAIIVHLVGGVLVGALSVGQFSFYLQTTLMLRISLSSLLREFSQLATNALYVQDRFDLAHKQPLLEWGTEGIHSLPPAIELKEVTMRYPNSTREALRNVSLIIQPGERVAIVGENGAGKSSLIRAILRLYDPSSGSIQIGGKTLNRLSELNHASLFSILPQDFSNFCLPLWESVTVCDRNLVDERRLQEAMDVAGLSAVVRKLPGGINQMLGSHQPNGVDLSGGEWQRVAITRALYRDAPILILDEPTSASDAKAEQEFFDRLFALERRQTVILISHRFSTVRKANKIFVMENGELTEVGTHDELVVKNGHYAALFRTQQSGYV